MIDVFVCVYYRSMYVESMGRTLQNLFKAYYSQLAKQDGVVAGKGDLVVVEEATLKSMFSSSVTKVRHKIPMLNSLCTCSAL